MWKQSLLALVLLAQAASNAAAQELDLTGRYNVEGVSPGNGNRYKGVVQVVRTDDTFQVQWKIGREEYRGTAILRNRGFAVVYQTVQGQAGLATYEVRPNGSLSGSWVGIGGTAMGSEVWNPSDGT